jgi:hypothetical protein
MNFMDDAFFVEGDGSTLLLDGLVVEQNTAQSTPWSAVAVRRKSIARITGSYIAENKALEFGVVVFDSTTIIQDSQISQNTGAVSKCNGVTAMFNTNLLQNLTHFTFATGPFKYHKRTCLCHH